MLYSMKNVLYKHTTTWFKDEIAYWFTNDLAYVMPFKNILNLYFKYAYLNRYCHVRVVCSSPVTSRTPYLDLAR